MLRPFVLLAALALTAPAGAQVLPSFGGDRAGTAGFQFLKIPVDPRAAALGQNVAAHASDASALFWNPALAAQGGRAEAALAHTRYFADVQMTYAAGYTSLRRSPVGPLTLGLSLHALDSGAMNVTDEFNPDGTGQTFRLVDLAVGLTAAQALTDLFSYGVTARYVREATAGVTAQTALADLGVFYRVGETGVQLGVAIRNFGVTDAVPAGRLERRGQDGQTVTETEFAGLAPPTTFLLAASYRPLRASREHDLVLAAQLSNPNDNAERLGAAAEYTWNGLLTLRGGYQFGVDEASLPSAGLGLRVPGLGPEVRLDYGYNQLDRLGAVHRVGVNVRLD
ncbi:MAG: PorV/PorQ family protein [Rubricoccaceae bacterium]